MDGIKLFKSSRWSYFVSRACARGKHSEHVTAIDLQINIGVNSSCFFLPSYYIFWFYSMVHFILLWFFTCRRKNVIWERNGIWIFIWECLFFELYLLLRYIKTLQNILDSSFHILGFTYLISQIVFINVIQYFWNHK